MKTIIHLTLFCLFSNTLCAQINEAIKFKITDPNGKTDETIIRLSVEATSQFDPFWDAWKGFTYNDNIPSLFSETSNNEALAINAINIMEKDTIMDLKMRTRIVGGVFTMETIQLGTFPQNIKIAIKDLETGIIYKLNQNQTFNFNVIANPNQDYERFEVFYSTKAEISISENDLTVTNHGNYDWNYTIIDNNQNVVNSSNSNTDTATVSDLPIGSYQVLIEDAYTLVDTLNFTIEYEDSIVIDTDTSSTTNENTSSIEETNSFNAKIIKTNFGYFINLSEQLAIENVNVQVYSINGKLIEVINSNSVNNIEIRLPQNGIYLIVLSLNEKQKVYKVPYFNN